MIPRCCACCGPMTPLRIPGHLAAHPLLPPAAHPWPHVPCLPFRPPGAGDAAAQPAGHVWAAALVRGAAGAPVHLQGARAADHRRRGQPVCHRPGLGWGHAATERALQRLPVAHAPLRGAHACLPFSCALPSTPCLLKGLRPPFLLGPVRPELLALPAAAALSPMRAPRTLPDCQRPNGLPVRLCVQPTVPTWMAPGSRPRCPSSCASAVCSSLVPAPASTAWPSCRSRQPSADGTGPAQALPVALTLHPHCLPFHLLSATLVQR